MIVQGVGIVIDTGRRSPGSPLIVGITAPDIRFKPAAVRFVLGIHQVEPSAVRPEAVICSDKRIRPGAHVLHRMASADECADISGVILRRHQVEGRAAVGGAIKSVSRCSGGAAMRHYIDAAAGYVVAAKHIRPHRHHHTGEALGGGGKGGLPGGAVVGRTGKISPRAAGHHRINIVGVGPHSLIGRHPAFIYSADRNRRRRPVDPIVGRTDHHCTADAAIHAHIKQVPQAVVGRHRIPGD